MTEAISEKVVVTALGSYALPKSGGKKFIPDPWVIP